MKPTKKTATGSTSRKKLTKVQEKADEDQEELDDPCEDTNEHELDTLDAADTPFAVPLIGGDAATFKRLANDEFRDEPRPPSATRWELRVAAGRTQGKIERLDKQSQNRPSTS